MAKDFRIYLSGAITGLSYPEANGWRKEIEKAFTEYGNIDVRISFFNPVDKFMDYYEERFPFRRDLAELRKADLMIINISKNPNSIGSNIEVGIAYEHKIPVIIYNPEKSNIHPWHLEIADAVTTSVSELIDLVKDFYIN